METGACGFCDCGSRQDSRASGGLSSKITDPAVIILEAWGWGLRVLARVRQTYV